MNMIGLPPAEKLNEDGIERRNFTSRITRSYIKAKLDGRDFANDARFNTVDQGLRIVRIREDSIYYKLGFSNEDIILADATFPKDLAMNLRKEKDISIYFLRNGVKNSMAIHIED
ncbi:MAG: hypothetical protein M3Q07_28280 [Pseudobdellovibrionaceae bacterium]|nr:hypothetical protein [Pseudobdellovibrionaceae bacterium]